MAQYFYNCKAGHNGNQRRNKDNNFAADTEHMGCYRWLNLVDSTVQRKVVVGSGCKAVRGAFG